MIRRQTMIRWLTHFLHGVLWVALIVAVAWWVDSFRRVELVGYSEPLSRATALLASRGDLLLILEWETGFNGPQLPASGWHAQRLSQADLTGRAITDLFLGEDEWPEVEDWKAANLFISALPSRPANGWKVVTEHGISYGFRERETLACGGGFEVIDGLIAYPDGQAIRYQRTLKIPAWAAGLVLGMLWVASVLRLVAARRTSRRKLDGQCIVCGYDLRASKSRCPECGTPIDRPAKAQR